MFRRRELNNYDPKASRKKGIFKNASSLIVSFAVDDPNMGVKSLILHRTLFFEEVFDEEERGVKVSMEGDYFDQEDYNILKSIKINDNEIQIKSSFREYRLDVSNIPKTDIKDMLDLLKKQNYDNRFAIQVA